MEIGDVVFTRSIRSYFCNATVRGHAVISAAKGKMLVFVCVGSCDESQMHGFDARAVLIAGGWTPPPPATSAPEPGAP